MCFENSFAMVAEGALKQGSASCPEGPWAPGLNCRQPGVRAVEGARPALLQVTATVIRADHGVAWLLLLASAVLYWEF